MCSSRDVLEKCLDRSFGPGKFAGEYQANPTPDALEEAQRRSVRRPLLSAASARGHAHSQSATPPPWHPVSFLVSCPCLRTALLRTIATHIPQAYRPGRPLASLWDRLRPSGWRLALGGAHPRHCPPRKLAPLVASLVDSISQRKEIALTKTGKKRTRRALESRSSGTRQPTRREHDTRAQAQSEKPTYLR